MGKYKVHSNPENPGKIEEDKHTLQIDVAPENLLHAKDAAYQVLSSWYGQFGNNNGTTTFYSGFKLGTFDRRKEAAKLTATESSLEIEVKGPFRARTILARIATEVEPLRNPAGRLI
jgi:hypothetical protein